MSYPHKCFWMRWRKMLTRNHNSLWVTPGYLEGEQKGVEWGKNHREKKIQIQSYYSVFSIIFKYQSSVQYSFSKLISKRSLCSIITAVQPVEFLTALILPIRWWQEQPLTAKQICFYCYSANTFGNDSKCLICFCKYDPLLVFCFRVSFTCSCQRSSFADHCWWSFPIGAIIIGTICSTEVSLHLLFSYSRTKMSSLHSHRFFTLLLKRETEQKNQTCAMRKSSFMPVTTRKKGQDLQVLKTAILQLFVSTLNKNVCSYLTHLSKDNVNEGKLFTVKKRPQYVLHLNCHKKKSEYYADFNYCNPCCHLFYTFLFLFYIIENTIERVWVEWSNVALKHNFSASTQPTAHTSTWKFVQFSLFSSGN